MLDHRFRVCNASLRGVLATAAITLALVACGGGTDSDDEGSGAGGESVGGEAQAIFIEQGCAECHGENGEGVDGESAVAGTRMIPLAFETRIRNGRGAAMPGYTEEQISDDEIQLLYEWLSNE